MIVLDTNIFLELYRQPGYMDNQKEGVDKYGDLLVWKSIIKIAKKILIFW